MTIYPDHSVGDRSGLHRGESSRRCGARFRRLICPLLTSLMRSESITRTLSQFPSHATVQDNMRDLSGLTHAFPHTSAEYTHLVTMDRGLCPVLRTHPDSRHASLDFCTSPHAFAVPYLGRAAPHRITGCHTATSFTSIRLGLGLVIYR